MEINTSLVPPIFLPSEEGPNGIRFDFNNGCRVMTPENIDAKYEILLYDNNSGNIVESCILGKSRLWMSKFKYYIDYKLVIKTKGTTVFSHDLDLSGREVLLYFQSECIGDCIAWFSYVERFMRKHRCKLGVYMNPAVAELFIKNYPEITFFDKETASTLSPYATYKLCVVYGEENTATRMRHWQVPLDALAGYLLGLDDEIRQIPPTPFFMESKNGFVAGKHICFAFHASRKYKEWNYEDGHGWDAVVEYVKQLGYRAICIDRDNDGNLHGAEDFTGNRPLTERAMTLAGARLFIGLPSGLAWLAWSVSTPIVMISGFSEPYAEMPHRRVQNTFVCHGCWNNPKYQLIWPRIMNCPEGTSCECTRRITPQQVINAIKEELGE